mgnify:CR=1 FL=1
MDLYKGIIAIHPSVMTINGNTEKTIVAKDKDNKKVTIDWTKVKAWKDPNEYHNGIDGWKKTIKAVKDKYPKE